MSFPPRYSSLPGLNGSLGNLSGGAGRRRFSRAFTLIEMLSVLALAGFLMAFVLPSIGSLGGQSFTKSVGDVGTILEQARTYAMANNTYVYVGLYEADAGQPDTSRPQAAGTGRVYIGVTASRDGTSGYLTGTWQPSNLTAINRIQHMDGLHLASVNQVAGSLPLMDSNTSGNNLDLSSTYAQTPFSGTNMGLPAAGNPVTSFSRVIQFSPSGSANIVSSLTSSLTVPPYIQIAFTPTHGNVATSTVVNCSGLQIDGVTGIVRSFKPGQL